MLMRITPSTTGQAVHASLPAGLRAIRPVCDRCPAGETRWLWRPRIVW